MALPSNEETPAAADPPRRKLNRATTVRQGEKTRDCFDSLFETVGLEHSPREQDDLEDQGVSTHDEPRDLVTFRVFFRWANTVLTNPVLWMDTLAIFCCYVMVVGFVGNVRWQGFSRFLGKEENIRAFLGMFSNVIGILLAFYTSMTIGRWWAMRQGVQNICLGATRLSLLLAHGVTTDKSLLEAVSRYSRASLFLIFAAGQRVKDPSQNLVERSILTSDEAHHLHDLDQGGKHSQAIVPWAWLANAVALLDKQKLTLGPPHYCSLLAAVDVGRDGVTSIQTYMETAIPQSYLHLLGLLVKLHNVLVASLYGLICVMHLESSPDRRMIPLFRTAFRSFFMPFLYNALLLINQDLTNPFSGDVNDLAFRHFDKGIQRETQAIIDAHERRPKWMVEHQYDKWSQ